MKLLKSVSVLAITGLSLNLTAGTSSAPIATPAGAEYVRSGTYSEYPSAFKAAMQIEYGAEVEKSIVESCCLSIFATVTRYAGPL